MDIELNAIDTNERTNEWWTECNQHILNYKRPSFKISNSMPWDGLFECISFGTKMVYCHTCLCNIPSTKWHLEMVCHHFKWCRPLAVETKKSCECCYVECYVIVWIVLFGFSEAFNYCWAFARRIQNRNLASIVC